MVVLVDADGASPNGLFGETAAQEGLRRRRCASSSRPTTTRTSACSSTAGSASGTACSSSLLLAAPWLRRRVLARAAHFMLIYAIVGLGLMLLAGFTGLFSLGHAAFLGVGAYTEAVLAATRLAVPAVDGRGGAALGGGRRRRRPAGAAREGHLPRASRRSPSASSSRRCSRAGRASPAATPGCT